MIFHPNSSAGWFLLLVAIVHFYFFLLSLSNILFLRLKSKRPVRTRGPKVSVLIPARNEERNIGRCLDSLVDQNYENYEIIVLDDASTDRTWEIIKEYERKHPHVSAIQGKTLPDDWFGKPHAMHQLAEVAAGEYYLFTDADTVHENDSVSWAMTNSLFHDVDLLSGYLKPIMRTWGERITVPNIYLNMAILLPFWLIRTTRIPLFSFAIGQLILFKAATYHAIGGYACVRKKITEDIYMAREIKRRGYRMIFLDAKRHSKVRMYTGFTQAVNGISKNIYDYFEKKLYPIVVLIMFLSIFVFLPGFVLIIQIFTWGPYLVPLTFSVGLFYGTYSMVLWNRDVYWYVIFLYPVLFSVLLLMGCKSVIDAMRGRGYTWKGRTVR